MEQQMIGRHQELSSFSRFWDSKKCFQILGIRSVGKSYFVNEFLKNKENGKDGDMIVSWIDVKRCLSKVKGICLSVFNALKIAAPRDVTTWVEIICSTVASQGDKSFVFVFDNAEDIIEGNTVQDFKHFCNCLIQICRNIRIIITSTTEMNCDDISDDSVDITIPPLSSDESEELFHRIAPTIDFGSHLHTIVKLCEGLPYVIAMTASELSGVEGDGFPLMTVPEMSLALQACRLETLSPFTYTQSDRIDIIYGTFLQRLPVPLQKKLATLGYIPGTFTLGQIREMVGDTTNEEAMERTRDPLMRRHVMTQDNTTQRYDIQGILRLCIDDLLCTVKNSPEVRQRFCKLFARIMTKISGMLKTSEYLEALCQFNQEQQNLQKLLTDVDLIYTNEDMYCVYMEVAIGGSVVLEQYMGADGFMMYKTLLRLSSKLDREMDEAYVRLCYGSALTNVKGNITEGEKQYRLTIAYLENHQQEPMVPLSCCYHGLKKDMRYHLALSYQRLGWNLYGQSRTTDSIIYLEKALQLENELNMYLDLLVLSTLATLGIIHNVAGNTVLALKYHTEVLKRRKELYRGENHYTLGAAYNNLGLTYQKMGLYQTSLECFQMALHMKKTLGSPEKSVAISVINVASALSENGRHEEAIQHVQEARDILNKNPGLYQEIMADVHLTEGHILLRKHLYKQSIQSFLKSLEIRKDIIPNNFMSADAYRSLAKAYVNLKANKKALYWFNKVFALHETFKSDAPTNTTVYECYSEVMFVLYDMQNYDEVNAAFNTAMNELQRMRDAFIKMENSAKTAWVDEQKLKLTSIRTTLL